MRFRRDIHAGEWNGDAWYRRGEGIAVLSDGAGGSSIALGHWGPRGQLLMMRWYVVAGGSRDASVSIVERALQELGA